jgi:hypothetical protein
MRHRHGLLIGTTTIASAMGGYIIIPNRTIITVTDITTIRSIITKECLKYLIKYIAFSSSMLTTS